jgi:hypothetical protein
MPHFCTRAAADPAPFGGCLARGTHAGCHALAIAYHAGRGAGTDTRGWVFWGRGHVTVRASEPAGTIVNARGDAISWVVAVRRRISCDLK